MWKKLYDYLFGLKAEKVTLEILFPEWMKQRENDKDLASNTIRRNKQIWEKYYHNHELIKLSIEKIKASQIKQFYKEYTQGRNITRRELGNIKIIMNGLFSMAVEHDMIMSNVALAVNTRDLKCKVVHNNDMIYTKNERDALLTYLETIPDNAYTLGISLMFCLDVRIGELKALNWSDYNADRKTITIQREIVDRYDDNGKWSQVELDHTKAGEGGDRVEPVSPRAQKILERLKKLNPDCNRIILNSSGTTLKTNKFNLYLKKYCTGCGIRYFSSHKMRFYAVTEQAKAGMDLVTIQYLSGHKNPDTTFKYMRTARLTNESNDKWDKVFN